MHFTPSQFFVTPTPAVIGVLDAFLDEVILAVVLVVAEKKFPLSLLLYNLVVAVATSVQLMLPLE